MLRHVPVDPSESHLSIQPGAEPILLRQQVSLEDGTNDQHRRHLDHAVTDARDAERPLASVALRYPYAQEGLGHVAPRNQLLPQHSQPLLRTPVVDPRERLAIHPCRSRVGAAATVGFQQNILSADFVPESIEAEGWFSLSFRL